MVVVGGGCAGLRCVVERLGNGSQTSGKNKHGAFVVCINLTWFALFGKRPTPVPQTLILTKKTHSPTFKLCLVVYCNDPCRVLAQRQPSA